MIDQNGIGVAGQAGVGVDDVDDVAIGDVARLGALERAAVLVEQQAQLDEQRRGRGDTEQSPLGPIDQPRRHRARRRRGDDAEPAELVVQRSVGEVGIEHGSVLDHHSRILQGDRHAVGKPHPLDAHDVGARCEA